MPVIWKSRTEGYFVSREDFDEHIRETLKKISKKEKELANDKDKSQAKKELEN